MRPVSRPVIVISLASVNGLVNPGPTTRTLSPIGTRSEAPHRDHHRPAQSRTLREGAPFRENVCMMFTKPSVHTVAQPSSALVRTEIVTSWPGYVRVDEM